MSVSWKMNICKGRNQPDRETSQRKLNLTQTEKLMEEKGSQSTTIFIETVYVSFTFAIEVKKHALETLRSISNQNWQVAKELPQAVNF